MPLIAERMRSIKEQANSGRDPQLNSISTLPRKKSFPSFSLFSPLELKAARKDGPQLQEREREREVQCLSTLLIFLPKEQLLSSSFTTNTKCSGPSICYSQTTPAATGTASHLVLPHLFFVLINEQGRQWSGLNLANTPHKEHSIKCNLVMPYLAQNIFSFDNYVQTALKCLLNRHLTFIKHFKGHFQI